MSETSGKRRLLCGTLTGVQPLVELDGEPIADGVVGPWTQQLAEALEKTRRGELT